MPLDHSRSESAFKSNVKTLMGEVGKSPHVQSRDQALAVAYSIKRRGKSTGGAAVRPNPPYRRTRELEDAALQADGRNTGKVPGFAFGGAPTPWQVKSEARSMMHSGPIMSVVPGRTDRHNMTLASNSYVMPAQAVSHLGQSNSMAGMKVLNSMFGHGGPYGAGAMPIKHGAGAPRAPAAAHPRKAGFDAGGDVGEPQGDGSPVDVVTAGGEYVIPPESVARVGGGDLKHGHNVLDDWVNSILADHIKTLKKLPGPAKS